jgi:hypothetical protein
MLHNKGWNEEMKMLRMPDERKDGKCQSKI